MSSKTKSDGVKVKDSLFGKIASEVKGGNVKEREVNYRHIFVGGKRMKVVKGEVLSKEDLKYFNKEAREYFLEKA